MKYFIPDISVATADTSGEKCIPQHSVPSLIISYNIFPLNLGFIKAQSSFITVYVAVYRWFCCFEALLSFSVETLRVCLSFRFNLITLTFPKRLTAESRRLIPLP